MAIGNFGDYGLSFDRYERFDADQRYRDLLPQSSERFQTEMRQRDEHRIHALAQAQRAEDGKEAAADHSRRNDEYSDMKRMAAEIRYDHAEAFRASEIAGELRNAEAAAKLRAAADDMAEKYQEIREKLEYHGESLPEGFPDKLPESMEAYSRDDWAVATWKTSTPGKDDDTLRQERERFEQKANLLRQMDEPQRAQALDNMAKGDDSDRRHAEAYKQGERIIEDERKEAKGQATGGAKEAVTPQAKADAYTDADYEAKKRIIEQERIDREPQKDAATLQADKRDEELRSGLNNASREAKDLALQEARLQQQRFDAKDGPAIQQIDRQLLDVGRAREQAVDKVRDLKKQFDEFRKEEKDAGRPRDPLTLDRRGQEPPRGDANPQRKPEAAKEAPKPPERPQEATAQIIRPDRFKEPPKAPAGRQDARQAASAPAQRADRPKEEARPKDERKPQPKPDAFMRRLSVETKEAVMDRPDFKEFAAVRKEINERFETEQAGRVKETKAAEDKWKKSGDPKDKDAFEAAQARQQFAEDHHNHRALEAYAKDNMRDRDAQIAAQTARMEAVAQKHDYMLKNEKVKAAGGDGKTLQTEETKALEDKEERADLSRRRGDEQQPAAAKDDTPDRITGGLERAGHEPARGRSLDDLAKGDDKDAGKGDLSDRIEAGISRHETRAAEEKEKAHAM